MKVVDEPITPPTAANGAAREERITPAREPNLLGAVLFDRVFGLDPRDLARACEAPIWSHQARVALRARHGPVLRAHAQYPDHLATSLEDVFRLYTGMSFARAAEAVRGRVAEAVQTTADFGVGLGNTMNRVLVSSYALPQYHEESISRVSIVRDFRPVRVVIPTIAPVAPLVAEGAAYTESAAGSTVAPSGQPVKYGIIESITMEALRNDDVGVIRRRVEDYGRMARRQRAAAVWGAWRDNILYQPDGLAWFSAGHNNTAATPLSAASLKAALLLLDAQTLPGTPPTKMGIPLQYPNLWLVVPAALLDVAFGLNQARGTVADAAFASLFGANNEQVIVNPFLTDANDWGIHYDASLAESLRVLQVDQEGPQVLIARDETEGKMFTHDVIQYRVAWALGLVLVDYRPAVKSAPA